MTAVPEDWADVTDQRTLRSDARRLIDCEGFAFLGQRLMRAAGYQQGRFVSVLPPDDSNTARDESSLGHIMFTAQRRRPDGGGREVVVISNREFLGGVGGSQAEIQAARESALRRGYSPIAQQGAIRGEAAEAWRAQYEAAIQEPQQTE